MSYRLFIKNNPEKIKKSQEKRIWTLNNTDYKERISKTLKNRYNGVKNPNYGKKWTEEQKLHLSEIKKSQFKDKSKNPMFDKVRITNGIINTIISKDEKLPKGFWYGMKKKRGT